MNIYEERLLIRQMAAAKREREKMRSVNAYAQRVAIPFEEWLKFKHQLKIHEWKKLKFYKRLSLYNEYQLDCVEVQMEYEHPKIYGLQGANTLF